MTKLTSITSVESEWTRCLTGRHKNSRLTIFSFRNQFVCCYCSCSFVLCPSFFLSFIFFFSRHKRPFSYKNKTLNRIYWYEHCLVSTFCLTFLINLIKKNSLEILIQAWFALMNTIPIANRILNEKIKIKFPLNKSAMNANNR